MGVSQQKARCAWPHDTALVFLSHRFSALPLLGKNYFAAFFLFFQYSRIALACLALCFAVRLFGVVSALDDAVWFFGGRPNRFLPFVSKSSAPERRAISLLRAAMISCVSTGIKRPHFHRFCCWEESLRRGRGTYSKIVSKFTLAKQLSFVVPCPRANGSHSRGRMPWRVWCFRC